MRVLVLGGSGFLGSHVVDELVVAGHSVMSLDRYPERFRQMPKTVQFFQSDFGNRGELEDVLRQGVDVLVHLVSSTIPQTSNEDPVFDVQSNLVESIALFELCVKHNVSKVVYVSSGGTVYGVPKTQGRISEDHSTLPLCSYGIVKLAVEHYLQLFHSLYGLRYHVLRLSNPYGARQDPSRKQGAAAVFVYKMLKEKTINIWGDGKIVRDFIHASDFARACLAAVESEDVGVVNIGSGTGLSIKELLSVTEEITGKSAKVNWLPSRGFDVPRVVLDCTRARDQLHWEATVGIEPGLVEMKTWMIELIKADRI